MGSTASALESAKQALKNADNFGQRETGNKKAGDDAPKAAPKPEKSDYTVAKEHRDMGHEPMGGTTADALNARKEMGRGVYPGE